MSEYAQSKLTNLRTARPQVSQTTESILSASALSAQDEAVKVLQETKAFVEDRDTLLDVINETDRLLGRLRDFGQDCWMIVYPQQKDNPAAHVGHLLRNGSEIEPRNTPHSRPSHPRAATNDQNNVMTDAAATSNSGLHILCLNNLNIPGRRISSGLKNIESSLLLRQSLASLLCSRIEATQSHLEDLRTRVMDRNSRILITGDLNAGKSTFVNALLGREVAPTDQQPCTEVMYEILDFSHNSSQEAIHAIPHGQTYDIHDPSTFETFHLDQLSELVSNANGDDDQPSPYQLLKVYIAGPSEPNALPVDDPLQCSDAISLLRSGDISVSFIDSPGLNRDTLSTMELFSKQSTIDVVVFVVSAENQFTLSAQEFLWAASQEKAYVFVVVNKWGAIRDKSKAERRIREQLRKLSPATWEERTELVHFVDSQEAVLNLQSSSQQLESSQIELLGPFNHLQRSLSSFVFLRRSISKLQPAQTYTRYLLHDLSMITDTNIQAAKQLYQESQTRLEKILPHFNRLSANSASVEESVNQIEEATVTYVHRKGRKILAAALEGVKEGKLVKLPNSQAGPAPYFPTYGGLLTIFQYAEDVRKVLLGSLEETIKYTEGMARDTTEKAVNDIRDNPTTETLLKDNSTTTRTFNPKAMFSKSRTFQLIGPTSGPHSQLTDSLGVAGVGDLIDFEKFNLFSSSSKVNESELCSTGIIGSIGFGTLTLFGTGVTGGRAFVEAIVKVSEIVGRRDARKWAGAAVAVLSVGFGLYLITDIPRAIPRNIGRKLEKDLNQLVSPDSTMSWVEHEVGRLTKETRKVVRLAGWDLRQRFKTALEEAGAETDEAKAEVRKALEVEAWLEEFNNEVEMVLQKVKQVGRVY